MLYTLDDQMRFGFIEENNVFFTNSIIPLVVIYLFIWALPPTISAVGQ